jgi:hypothetical protein
MRRRAAIYTRNNSHIYNYAEWNKRSRVEAAKHVDSDTREQPKPQEEGDPDKIQIICPPAGLMLLSGPYLHETVPNTSGIARYSIDFRTVHYGDAVAHLGAENVRLALHEDDRGVYLRCLDLAHLPEAPVALQEDEIRKPRT